MYFDDIIGHSDQIVMLKAMLNIGKMPHALLFTGPEGIGKMMVASSLAAGILCSDGSPERPCGFCQSCKLMMRSAHPDFLLVSPEDGSIKIDQVRALQRSTGLAPNLGEYRVCILENADTMTIQAQNSLLKLLEEPPASLIFLLTVSSPERLVPTILSRCRSMRFQPLPYRLLADTLTSRGIAVPLAIAASRLSGGRMGTAQSILAPGGLALRDQAALLAGKLPDGNLGLVWEQAAAMEKMDNKSMLALLQYLIYILRDLFLLLTRQDRSLLYNTDLIDRLSEEAFLWSEDRLCAALGEVTKAQRALSGHANTRLTMEALLIRLVGG